MKATLSILADVLAAQRQSTRPTAARKKSTETQAQSSREPTPGNAPIK